MQIYIPKKVKFLHEMIEFATFECQFYPMYTECMVQYKLFYKNRVLNQNDVFNTMVVCKCCARHQIRKPLRLEHLEDTAISYDQTVYCHCPCRHISRMICRTVD